MQCRLLIKYILQFHETYEKLNTMFIKFIFNSFFILFQNKAIFLLHMKCDCLNWCANKSTVKLQRTHTHANKT